MEVRNLAASVELTNSSKKNVLDRSPYMNSALKKSVVSSRADHDDYEASSGVLNIEEVLPDGIHGGLSSMSPSIQHQHTTGLMSPDVLMGRKIGSGSSPLILKDYYAGA